MRDIAVVLMFMVIAVAAFRRPFYGALLWVLFGLMNPHRLSFGFAYSLPFAQMAVVVTVLAAMFHARDVRWPRGVPIYILLAFVAWMGLSTANAMVPAPSWTKFVDVLKVLGMTLVVATLIRTREEIVGLVWTMVFSIGFFGFKGGIFTIGTGGSYRVWGPPGSLVEGNNELAVALIMTIPLMYFLTTHPVVARDFWPLSRIPVRLIRFGGFLAMLLCTASALGSQSRGALVAIVAMSTVLWWRSQSKLSIALVAAAAVLVALPLLPDTWWDRMETIQTYDEDLSALQRLNAWQTAINIAGDRVTGAGYATAHPVVFGIYSPNQGPEWIYVAHSIYFQVLGDHGYVGLLMYLALWVATYFTAGRTARLARQYADLAWAVTLLNMCKVSMVGYAVGGAFLSLAYWDMPYYLMVLVVVTRMLVRRQIDQRGVQMPVAAPDGGAPLRPAGV
ncbi:MAG: putative O-glycosylation ligase, exosortase A system-associated [Rhodoferax sp.]|nr:putative O-glycosylation ligase, exosortase A system-associated [Rhodoferax sp.]